MQWPSPPRTPDALPASNDRWRGQPLTRQADRIAGPLQVEPAKDDVGLGTGRRLQQRRHTRGAAGQDARVGSIDFMAARPVHCGRDSASWRFRICEWCGCAGMARCRPCEQAASAGRAAIGKENPCLASPGRRVTAAGGGYHERFLLPAQRRRPALVLQSRSPEFCFALSLFGKICPMIGGNPVADSRINPAFPSKP